METVSNTKMAKIDTVPGGTSPVPKYYTVPFPRVTNIYVRYLPIPTYQYHIQYESEMYNVDNVEDLFSPLLSYLYRGFYSRAAPIQEDTVFIWIFNPKLYIS